MGDTIWVQTNDNGLADGDDYDHSFMVRLEKPLERIAKDAGLDPLSVFYDGTAMEEAYADEFGDDLPRSEPNWSDAKVGLAVITKLSKVISDDPAKLGASVDQPSVSRLVEELEHAKKVLRSAVRKKRQFRLLLVP
ncbi:MAG: hypothetical protein RMA76_31215 [Deltaproteobacteria bacterium]|jgi:hypothetical protein